MAKGKTKKKKKPPDRTVARNKGATRKYNIESTLEAGIVLLGTEIKAIREGKASMSDSYGIIKGGEVFLDNMHIGQYSHGNVMNHDPKRRRKLLLHSSEIRKLIGKVSIRGMTLVPLDIHINDRGIAKVTLALAKGMRQYDRREELKRKEMKRELEKIRGQHKR